MATPTSPPDRPLRRDAQRNLRRIREAATKVFRERGLDASHEVIAREADVSVGTVYRRFPDREQLIDALFEHELDAVVAVAEEALGMDDPWAGVVHLFERSLELSSENLGLKQLITGSRHGAEKIERTRDRLAPLMIEIIERARAAGAIRSDAAPQDVPMTVIMLSPLIDGGRQHAPDLWRRHLALVLDGLRPEGQRRDPLPPTVPIDVIDQVVAASHDAG
jgi:AcrR family transcriptional regulator